MRLKQVGRRREGFHISFKMPKIGLQSSIIGLKSWRLRFSFTKREWSAQDSGSAHFSLRLKNACLGKCSRSAIPQQHAATNLAESATALSSDDCARRTRRAALLGMPISDVFAHSKCREILRLQKGKNDIYKSLQVVFRSRS